MMDINDIRGITTLMLMVGFIGLVYFVYRPEKREDYEKAARSALDDDLNRTIENKG